MRDFFREFSAFGGRNFLSAAVFLQRSKQHSCPHSCGLGCSKGERCIGITMAARDARLLRKSPQLLAFPIAMAFRSKLNTCLKKSRIQDPSSQFWWWSWWEFWSQMSKGEFLHCVIVMDLQHDFITAWVNIFHLRFWRIAMLIAQSACRSCLKHSCGSNSSMEMPGPSDFRSWEILWNIELVQKDAEFFFLIFVDHIFKQNVWFFYEMKCGSLKQCAVQTC